MKKIFLVVSITVSFFLGYLVSVIYQNSEKRMEVYTVTMDSLTQQMANNLAALDKFHEDKDFSSAIKCLVAANYVAMKHLTSKIKEDQALPWNNTYYLDPINTYEKTLKQIYFGSDPEIYYRNQCEVFWHDQSGVFSKSK